MRLGNRAARIAALVVFVLSVTAFGAAAFATGSRLISTNAGWVAGTVVTTREVLLNRLIEGALFPSEKLPVLHIQQVKSYAFIHETTSVLLEIAIAKEAAAFGATPVSKKQFNKSVRRVEKRLRNNPLWRELSPTNKEIKEIVETKLRAKNFLKFKVDAATIPVSNDEAKAYFEANKLKFENLPFANFKETIKAYLTKQRVDARLRDWFVSLRSKYHIRNDLAE